MSKKEGTKQMFISQEIIELCCPVKSVSKNILYNDDRNDPDHDAVTFSEFMIDHETCKMNFHNELLSFLLRDSFLFTYT